MQDILDSGSTTHIESSREESVKDSDDESFQDLEDNTNYSNAKRELRELEKYKLKKYQPTFVKPVGGGAERGVQGECKGTICRTCISFWEESTIRKKYS
jgi:hypothetical protein